jgi:hypothetical protein
MIISYSDGVQNLLFWGAHHDDLERSRLIELERAV